MVLDINIIWFVVIGHRYIGLIFITKYSTLVNFSDIYVLVIIVNHKQILRTYLLHCALLIEEYIVEGFCDLHKACGLCGVMHYGYNHTIVLSIGNAK